MISYDEALTRMLAKVTPLSSERVPLVDAAGRTLAEPVTAAIDAPRRDVSAMDGYAVRHEDAKAGDWLELVGVAAAGSPFAGEIAPGQAVRIFTGAHIPSGTDCVVIQEEALRDGNRVRFNETFGPSRHIRQQGSDFRSGDTLLDSGTYLSPNALVALAGADQSDVKVTRRPLVSIIATGDELVDPGTAASSISTIPESGSFGVAAMASFLGASVVGRFRGKDTLQTLEELAAHALEISDLVVVIGGASVGDHDLAKPMFEPLGLSLLFSKVAIKPGKPVWFGTVGKKYILGLPGNPGSAMVTARLFLAPMLVALQGGRGEHSVAMSPQRLAQELPASGNRETFTRARMDTDGLRAVRNQESGAQAPLAGSDWLIRRSAGDGEVAEGQVVYALPF